MAKKLEIMKPLDQALFRKLDDLQGNSEVQKILDAYANLDEKPQEAVKALMALLLFLIPVGTLAVLYGMNSSLMSELETKKKLLETSQNIVREKSGVQSAQGEFLGNSFVGTERDMQSLVSRSAGMAGIDPSKISVSGFNAFEREGFITEASINMKFKGLSNSEFFSLVASLSDRQKARFDEISVKKNQSDNLLEGVATLLYFSRDEGGASL